MPKAPGSKKQERPGSRIAALREKGRDPKLPEAPLPYLMDLLFEVGPAQGGGFGPLPITHQELLAWQVNMRRFLQPWEVSMLRRLSVEWIAEAHRAEAHDASAPWTDEAITGEELVRVADDLRESMRRLAS